MKILEIISKKRDGFKLNYDDFNFIAKGAASGTIADYQLSSWLMACFLNGLDKTETSLLTKAMAFSGKRLDLREIKKMKVDKHSTGGVGDGISLALAPIVASCGVCVPMMSGRGLGHTGGTLDKLESVKNFQVRLPYNQILRQLKAIDVCMFGQTSELAPADKKLYALRDATCTVESIPLIVASILSKKYAEGINALVMDVKFGTGAFMKDYSRAKNLAVALTQTAKMLGIRSVAVLSNMNFPLGRAIGNGIEMEQSIRILKGEKISSDFEELLYLLSGYMIYLGKKARTVDEGIEMAVNSVKTGKALEKMREMIKWQKGEPRVCDNPYTFLPRARLVTHFKARYDGYITRMDARTIGWSTIALGVGRTRAEDIVDYKAGIWLEKKYGDKVKKGDIIASIYGSDISKINECLKIFSSAVNISRLKPANIKLIGEIIK
ncbi:MAG TPA: thymidine phosphorylase [Elusimicrobiales bacterium]|nr:thymidine phosphorylase [Elusimicrobiales bacterium]HOL62486.1 thymidine phosphorylase [Elusimicrobiales bacterium]